MWKDIDYIKTIISESLNKSDVLEKLNLPNNGGNYNKEHMKILHCLKL